jgi:hypothetical protein
MHWYRYEGSESGINNDSTRGHWAGGHLTHHWLFLLEHASFVLESTSRSLESRTVNRGVDAGAIVLPDDGAVGVRANDFCTNLFVGSVKDKGIGRLGRKRSSR